MSNGKHTNQRGKNLMIKKIRNGLKAYKLSNLNFRLLL